MACSPFRGPGVSVALDLPMHPGLDATVDALAAATIAEGGEDLSGEGPAAAARALPGDGDSRLPEFERVRRIWDPERKLRSAQSVRLMGDPR